MSAPDLRISYTELVTLLTAAFVRAGTSPAVASSLAANCAACERDGAHSHGIFRIPGYISSLKSGWVDGQAIPIVEDAAGSFLRVDARNGFAQPALATVADAVEHKARASGVAIVAIRNSHHFSALWPDIEPFAERGLIALTLTNSFAFTVPYGARTPIFGTNPVAFAAPTDGDMPIVFDMATSAMAHGDVQIAAREGRALPEGVGVDATGRMTTDAASVIDGGALLPFGGIKGTFISMMVEVLSAALTGGNFSYEYDWTHYPGALTPWTGQFLLLIDPGLAGGSPFAARTTQLVDAMRSAGLDRMPGERRWKNRTVNLRDGIPISLADIDYLKSVAGR